MKLVRVGLIIFSMTVVAPAAFSLPQIPKPAGDMFKNWDKTPGGACVLLGAFVNVNKNVKIPRDAIPKLPNGMDIVSACNQADLDDCRIFRELINGAVEGLTCPSRSGSQSKSL